MIKKIILLSLLLAIIDNAHGQRYLSKTFDSVTVEADIQYGFNFNYKGDSTKLYLDIYAPYGDTAIQRPVIVLAHGGSFVQGNRKAADIVNVCKKLAEMGYVTVSIQYRLGVNITSGNTLEKEFQQAVFRGAQDGRAAIRFLNKSVQKGNTYKINSNEIYAGGISAGGVLGLQLAFLESPSEIASLVIDTTVVGGVEGNSGNAGYSWKVKGVINLCGAMGNVSWMNNNKEISICNMHGTNDATVPYKTNYFKFFNNNVAILQGGFSVDSSAQKQGVDTRLFTFNGADHVPFAGTTTTAILYMDTTIKYVASYLYKNVTGLIPIGIQENKIKANSFVIYPNPAIEELNLKFETKGKRQVIIYTLSGEQVYKNNIEELAFKLNISSFARGIYFIEIMDENGVGRQKMLVN
jgi:poly(3-hydroxybutyrate) depolymerase